MRNPRVSFSVLVLLAVLSVPLRGGEPIDPDVLALRESAWRAWFAGDEAALLAMLPEDFLGIGWGGSEIVDRGKTIAASRAFKRSEEHTSELQSPCNLVCRLLLEKKKKGERRRLMHTGQ